jgi:hypothetical protein
MLDCFKLLCVEVVCYRSKPGCMERLLSQRCVMLMHVLTYFAVLLWLLLLLITV